MSGSMLNLGSQGEAVRTVQELLNRNGALVEEDGLFGRGTERAVREFQAQAGLPVTGTIDAATHAALSALPEPCPPIATTAVTFIAVKEVGSRAEYDQYYARPTFPGGESGITIGVGYDLRFQTDTFHSDWGGLLTPAHLAALGEWLGRQGTEDGVAALAALVVPWRGAWIVFTRDSLPKYVVQTRDAFPNFDDLPRLSRGALVSLVYNRGASMDPDDDRRKEMREFRDAMAARDYAVIPGYFRAMKRLWPHARGLRIRRDEEAALFEEGLASLTA
jgi:hypothetical protein